jgi:hypothetical protein
MCFDVVPAQSDANWVLGEVPRDAVDEVDGVLALSAKSSPFDIPSEPSLFRGETPRNEDDVDGL